MARIDAAVAGASVVARCVDGRTAETTTAKDGTFTLAIDEPATCLVQVRGGLVGGAQNEIVLHGISTGDPARINPLTELVLAHAWQVSPVMAFASYPADRTVSAAMLGAAESYLSEQLVAAGLPAPVFASEDSIGAALDALATQLGAAEQSLTTLVDLAAERAAWGTTLASVASTWTWTVPLTLVAPAESATNPMSPAKVTLGRFLFYDKRLSGNGTMACAGCHHQDKAFTDGRALAVGSTDEEHPRSALGLGNIVYNPTLTWAHATAESLEKQMETPMFGIHPVEMGVNDENRAEILQRFAADDDYRGRFEAAFPGQDNIISFPNIIRAIASFQRTLLTGDSAYDRATRGGGPPLTASQARGATLFFTSANCFRCHGNFNFTDTYIDADGPMPELRFHNTGLFNIGGTGAFPAPNRGIFEITGVASDMGKFRAPSLRNIAVTAPYMHDGSIATLEEVLDFYADGGRNITEGPNAGDGRTSPFKSDIVNGTNKNLTTQDKADVVAFLLTLTDEGFLNNPDFADPFVE